MNQKLESIVTERGKVYGDPSHSHTNIGLAWTGLLQQHYGITLDHPLPNWLVAQMMVQFKIQRSARVFKDDNYDDAAVYTDFARNFQNQSNETTKPSPDPAQANCELLQLVPPRRNKSRRKA